MPTLIGTYLSSISNSVFQINHLVLPGNGHSNCTGMLLDFSFFGFAEGSGVPVMLGSTV